MGGLYGFDAVCYRMGLRLSSAHGIASAGGGLMNLPTILVLLLLAAAVIMAVRVYRRHCGKSDCCRGDCSCCAGNCKRMEK